MQAQLEALARPDETALEPRFVVGRCRETRFWQVVDASGALVCVPPYKRGALEVVRRLNG